MSFIGAVAAKVRKVLANYAKEVTGPVLLIGAGNFTVASVLRSGGYQGEIRSCDVSLYTSALGAYLADKPFEVIEKADCPEQLQGLLCVDSIEDLVASISLLYDLREVWQCKNLYQVRIVKQYRDKWPQLMEKTKTKLQEYKKHIGQIDYEAKDGFDLLAESDPGCTVFAFPPTYKAGYEKLEKLLRASIEWDPPPYKEMTDKDMSLYEEIARFKSYFVVLEKDLPDVHAILQKPSAILPRGRTAFSHIICKKVSKKIVLRNKIKSENIGPFWPANREITGNEKLTLGGIRLGQSIRLNELFLSARINYFSGGVGVSLAFMLDGFVFGKADFCPSTHKWKLEDDLPMIYVMSDLALPSVEPRLAKLVLMAMMSRDVKNILNMKYAMSFGWAGTTAFSSHPASMKYRGIFKKQKMKESDGGYLLNYCCRFGDYQLSQVLDLWTKKYKKNSQTSVLLRPC